LSHAPRSKQQRADAGFTLVEVLVALAVISIGLLAIGSVVASTMRGTQAIDSHVMMVEAIRSIITALPERSQLMDGSFSGENSEYKWRVDVRPFVGAVGQSNQASPWVPQRLLIRLQSAAGSVLEVETIRLRPRGRQ
jgi:general secretion pathway protein I